MSLRSYARISSFEIWRGDGALHDRFCDALRDQYHRGEIPAEEYEVEENLEKNRISNISIVRSAHVFLNT